MTENLVPIYNENIIVGVVYEGKFDWYLTDKEIWFLDYQKRIEAFEKRGYKINLEYIEEERKGLLILDSDNASIFLERIRQDRVDTKWLRTLLTQKTSERDEDYLYDFWPSLYIDFDNQKLISCYPEPASYESYAPPHWEGKYGEFLNLIPKENRYWIDKNENNMLEEGRR